MPTPVNQTAIRTMPLISRRIKLPMEQFNLTISSDNHDDDDLHATSTAEAAAIERLFVALTHS
jgi:hypothetical protein